MKKQYFRFKIKDYFLPKNILNYININKVKREYGDIYYVDNKYLRKLKIENIENNISNENKLFLEYLIDERFIQLVSDEEYIKISSSTTTWTTGFSHSGGISGSSGQSGFSGVSGPVGLTGPSNPSIWTV